MAQFGPSVARSAGVIGFAKTLSIELVGDNIRVNTICPGLILTPRFAASSREDDVVAIDAASPLARRGRADEVGGSSPSSRRPVPHI